MLEMLARERVCVFSGRMALFPTAIFHQTAPSKKQQSDKRGAAVLTRYNVNTVSTLASVVAHRWYGSHVDACRSMPLALY